MSRKTTADTLMQRMQDLESELADLKRVTSSIHSSHIYKDEISSIYHDQLLNFISDGITVLDQSGIILYVNKPAETTFNFAAAELIGKRISDFVVSVGKDTAYLQSICKSFKHHPPKTGEYLIHLANRKQLTVHLKFALRRDPLSSAKHLWIIHRDLTKEKQLKDELNRYKERLENLTQNLPDLILNVDLNGTILFINPDHKRKNINEVVGTSIYDHMLPEDHEQTRTKIKKVFDTGKEEISDCSWIGSDSIVRWYTTRITPIKHDNQVIAAALNARDNSEKKKTEEELKNLQNMLDSVLRPIPGTLVILDKKNNVMASNWQGFKKQHSSSQNEKHKCQDLCFQNDFSKNDCHAKKVFETGKPVKVEVFNATDNGYKEIRAYPVLNDLGSVRYVVEHIQDITQRKKSEEKVGTTTPKTEAAQRLNNEFLSKISHELKTPMIGILGFSKLGIERYKKVTKEKLKGYFKTILESGEKLQTLLNNLVDLSQLEMGDTQYDYQNEKLSMVTTIILNEMFTVLNKNRIKVDFQKPDFSDHVIIDVDRIGKVVRNLVTNAVKFSKPDSTIKIEINEINDQIQFAVTDTGKGIPHDELTIIFDKFGQNDHNRSNDRGLGLAISKKIITDHKGKIWAENHPSEGSVFLFNLPKSAVNKSIKGRP